MFGFFPAMPWWGYVLFMMVTTQLTILSVTLFLHRGTAHRSIDFHPAASHFFRCWLWLATGMVTKAWAAIHRKHHARSDQVGDPHSPQAMGLRKVLLEGAELYRAESQNQDTLDRFGQGTPDDWVERNLYAKHSGLGVKLLLIIYLSLFGVVGLLLWAIQMAWIPFFAAGVINGVGHFWGYRNYETKDAARNILPIGFFLGGEELHNNHHAFGTSAKFSVKWWEFDLGWMVIKGLQQFGLATPRRIMQPPKTEINKNQLDTDTVKALITHRLQVMARYAGEVIIPCLEAEKKGACSRGRTILRNAKTVLVRESSLMKASQELKLRKVLENFQSLRVVYQFRMKLQAIWNKSSASQKELLEALHEWCQQAEETRLEVLHRFARVLRTYVPSEATSSA